MVEHAVRHPKGVTGSRPAGGGTDCYPDNVGMQVRVL